jgi:hypothetical protein
MGGWLCTVKALWGISCQLKSAVALTYLEGLKKNLRQDYRLLGGGQKQHSVKHLPRYHGTEWGINRKGSGCKVSVEHGAHTTHIWAGRYKCSACPVWDASSWCSYVTGFKPLKVRSVAVFHHANLGDSSTVRPKWVHNTIQRCRVQALKSIWP